jgi:hypothetical protein
MTEHDALLRTRMDEIDEAEVVIAEQEAVRTDAQDTAGAAVDNGPSIREGEKTCDEVARRSVCW